MFFQLLSTIKVNIVAKIMQCAYLCVIFHVKHKKIPFLAVLTWFLILGKIQDGGQDGDHCWWRHRPPAAPPPLKLRHLVFPRKGKSFQNTATFLPGFASNRSHGLFCHLLDSIFWHQLRVRGLYGHTVQGSWLSRPYDFASVNSFGKQVASVRIFGL